LGLSSDPCLDTGKSLRLRCGRGGKRAKARRHDASRGVRCAICGCETRALTDHSLTSILYFVAILSGAGLAFAWLTAAPPVLVRLAARSAPLFQRLALHRVKAVLASRPAIALLLLLPFLGVAGALYVYGGGSESTEQRNALLDRARKEAPHDLAAAVTQLEQRLAKEPDDADGWRLLSRSYGLLGETEKAADAARRAAALDAKGGGEPADPSAAGEDLVTANSGKVVPEARRLFEAALAANPGDPRARFFLGLGEAQDGHGDQALTSWLALEADSPPDAPWLAGLRANIDRLAGSMGIGTDDLAQRRAALAKAPPAAGATPGPSAADVAAAATMSSDDRAAMIRSMVQRLADRLEHEPGDVDGWLRLGRAYGVLGEQQKSLDAYRRATEADPKREDARTAYANARLAAGEK
jgi:cytochrome c-type biogenesis protein CcmH